MATTNYYAKVNKKVFTFMSKGWRNQLKDGNYIIFQSDLMWLGNELDIKFQTGGGTAYADTYKQFVQEVAEQVGGLLLTVYEAKDEQDGTTLRELPAALDQRFVLDDDTAAEPTTDSTEEPSEEPEQTEEEEPAETNEKEDEE
jgi:hypothetical protein